MNTVQIEELNMSLLISMFVIVMRKMFCLIKLDFLSMMIVKKIT
uniref:Uncharacterized protein n=1 Tax=Cucumis melo TaxID=3656 RepID=A0A9I9ECL8_CUCME